MVADPKNPLGPGEWYHVYGYLRKKWDDGNIRTEIAHGIVRDSMVRCLLPIDDSLLLPPVRRIYEKTFQDGWNDLDGREDQLFVAEQAAIIERISLRTLKDKQP